MMMMIIIIKKRENLSFITRSFIYPKPISQTVPDIKKSQTYLLIIRKNNNLQNPNIKNQSFINRVTLTTMLEYNLFISAKPIFNNTRIPSFATKN